MTRAQRDLAQRKTLRAAQRDTVMSFQTASKDRKTAWNLDSGASRAAAGMPFPVSREHIRRAGDEALLLVIAEAWMTHYGG